MTGSGQACLAPTSPRIVEKILYLNFAERRLLEAQAIWEGGLLEMVGLTETVLEEYEAGPDPGVAAGLRRIPVLGGRQRAFLEHLAQEAPTGRARRLAEMLLDYTATWNARAESAMQQIR